MAETNSNNQELPKESTPEKKPIMDESLTKDPTKTNGIDDKSITDPLNEVKETDTKDADILKNDHISDSEVGIRNISHKSYLFAIDFRISFKEP